MTQTSRHISLRAAAEAAPSFADAFGASRYFGYFYFFFYAFVAAGGTSML